MCALRHYRSIQPVSLANQYRLDMKPKRPQPRKLIRRKKIGGPVSDEIEQEERRRLSEASEFAPGDHDADDWEEFDFDAEDDYLDAAPGEVDLAQRYYLAACENLKVMPIKCIHDGLIEDLLECKNVTLQTNDAKACTIALVGNSMCEGITFGNNDMGPEGGRYFGDMLTRNNYISDVIIVWNRLCSLGAESICKALLKNNTVKKLDLTGNDFKETDAIFFKELLEVRYVMDCARKYLGRQCKENITIQELNLSHNYFREDGGEYLARGITQNDTVLVLDLSWNHLRLRGAMAIGYAIERNEGLEVLNLSWNGFHMEGLAMLGQALARNTTLLELDVTCNRIVDLCLPKFLQGLQKNTTLKKLNMSKNQITNAGALTILTVLKEAPSIALDFVDFGDKNVKEDLAVMVEELKKTKDIDIKHGKVWQKDRDPLGKQDQSEDEIALLQENPHFVLMEFMRLQKLRLVDLFHQMDKDNSNGISIDEFTVGLNAVDIPLKRKTLEQFVKSCDSDKNGEIDYSELMEANRQYKDHLRKQLKANEPIEKSPIGRIQKLLRKIMISNGSLRHSQPPPQTSIDTSKWNSSNPVNAETTKFDK